MKTLTITRELKIPREQCAEQVYALVGKRGSGKSNAAAVIVEQMLKAGVQVIILDPVSIWWSLRMNATGKRGGFNVPVFGGDHGDIPLTAESAGLVAETLAASNDSAVIDVSDFTLTKQRAFAAEFAERFFQAKKKHRSPVLLVLEEAAEFIPQHVVKGMERMFGAFKRIAKIGRNFGIGLLMIDHRPQEIHKAILNLAEVLFAFQMNGKHERKAIAEWVEEKDPERSSVIGELPGLGIGQAQCWSPAWLHIFKRIQFGLKTTYDAGHSRDKQQNVRIKPIDMEKLRRDLDSMVKAAEENNPVALKRRIAELERELRNRKTDAQTIAVEKRIEVPVYPAKATILRLANKIDDVSQVCMELAKMATLDEGKRPRVSVAKSQKPAPAAPMNTTNGAGIGKGETKVLTAIAQHADGVDNEQLSALTGYKRSSRDTYVQRLRSAGYVVKQGDTITATDAGMAALGDDFTPLPTGADLQAYWLNRLSGGEREILKLLLRCHPDVIGRDFVSEELPQYKRSSRDTYIQRLTVKKLAVVTGPGEVRASDNLF